MSALDLSSLTLLVDILDAGSLSAAARKLKMSRANMSYRLTQLERAAGAQLIRRTTRRVEATDLGHRLYEHAARIRAELLAAQEALTQEQEPQGRLRLSVPTGFGDIVMSPWLIEFKIAYPKIVLDVTFENRVQDLLREEIDIAVRVMSEPPPSLVARAMRPVSYVACASRAYAAKFGMPVHPDQLGTMPLITSGVVGRALRLSAYLGDHRHEVLIEPTLISENFPFLRSAILAGIGIGLVPDYVVHEAKARGDVVTALNDWRLSIFGTHMFMLYMPDRYRTKATQTLIEFLLARARVSAQTLPDSVNAPG